MLRVNSKPVCLIVGFVLLGTSVAGAGRPNIILIMADDLGHAGLSCYGNEHGIETPNLDRLAAGGIKFLDFHSNGAVCSPTRAALMTGRYQQRTGITAVIKAANLRNQGLALQEVTIAEWLQESGYATGLFGKWHLGYSPKFNPVQQGFDEFVGFVSGNVDYHSHLDRMDQEDWWKQDQLSPERGYQTELIGSHAVEFIQRNQAKPFFAYVAFGAPHTPLQGPNDPSVRGPNKVPQKQIDLQRAYREMIESMDAEVGRIETKVDQLGLSNSTFIFFCSDNGQTQKNSWSGSRKLRGSKGTVYEGGNRVPAIAYWPGKIVPAASDETALTMDLLPTIAALVEAPLPAEMIIDGVDLSPVLLRGQKQPARTLFWQNGDDGAARQGKWKYVRSDGQEALYDLASDLGEQLDLSSQHPDRLEQLRNAFFDWHKRVSASPTGPEIDPHVSSEPVGF